MKYIIFLVSLFVFSSVVSAHEYQYGDVIVPAGVKCPIKNPNACLTNLVAAYNDLFEEKVALEKVNATSEVVSNEIRTCEANLADANAVLAEVVDARSSIQAELSSLRARLSSTEMDLASARSSQGVSVEVTSLHANTEQLRAENSSLSSQLQLVKQQLAAALSSQTVQAQSFEVTSTAEVAALSGELSQARLQLDTLMLENQALKTRMAEMPTTQAIVQTETVTVFPEDYETLRSQVAQLQGQLQTQPQPETIIQTETVVQTETVTVVPEDYYTMRDEIERLNRELAASRQVAPMQVAPAPVMVMPAPEK